MVMTRIEFLSLQRKEVLLNLTDKKKNRASLLTKLMDIDDELEEIRKLEDKATKWRYGGYNNLEWK